MELWIRNQNKDRLIKCHSLDILDRNESPIVQHYLKEIKFDVMIIGNDNVNLGTYTKERALEILDDISKQIKNLYLVEVMPMMKLEYIEEVEEQLNTKYNGEFIMQPRATKIEPINSNIIFYEMPKE